MELSEQMINNKYETKPQIMCFSRLKIDSINIKAFQKFSNLLELDLSNNKLKTIGLEFKYLGNLKKLYLGQNEIESINTKAFQMLDNLQEIDLSTNQLDNSISEYLFEGLTNLTDIYLNDNKFSHDSRLYLVLESKVKHVSFKQKTRHNNITSIDNALYYDMNHEKRGIALLINNNIFKDNDTRHGSEKDLEDLHSIFEKMQFNVVIEENKTCKEIKELLSKYSGPNLHKNSDCFLCVVMSHGNQDGVLGVDGLIFDLKKAILDSFQNRLIGKPKLFFVNSCRGSKEMGAVFETAKGPTKTASVIPTHSDILISYSSVEEFVSKRDQHYGSWYIQSLVKMFNKHYVSTQLVYILTRVNNDVTKRGTATNKQTPTIVVNTLRKRVLFNSIKK